MPSDSQANDCSAIYRANLSHGRAGAASVLRCPMQQDGIVSEVFCRILQSDDFDSDAHGKRYFYRAGRNAALNRLRAQEREVDDPDTVLGARSTPMLTQPDAILLRKEMQLAVRRAVAALPPRRREVAELCLLEEWTCREAAGHLGVSVKRVEKQRARAINDLRAALAEVGIAMGAHLRGGEKAT